MRIHITLGLVVFAGCANANDTILFPFEGLYESRGSVAKEKLGGGQWRDIPQDVQLRIVKDGDVVELKLRIQVQSPEAGDDTDTYTIENDVWLVTRPSQEKGAESGRVDFDVYKLPDGSDRFADLGDGYCTPSQCRFNYVTPKHGHRQRYDAWISWQPASSGTEFRQSGGLSLQPAGRSDWSSFKTWENVFTRVPPNP